MLRIFRHYFGENTLKILEGLRRHRIGSIYLRATPCSRSLRIGVCAQHAGGAEKELLPGAMTETMKNACASA